MSKPTKAPLSCHISSVVHSFIEEHAKSRGISIRAAIEELVIKGIDSKSDSSIGISGLIAEISRLEEDLRHTNCLIRYVSIKIDNLPINFKD